MLTDFRCQRRAWSCIAAMSSITSSQHRLRGTLRSGAAGRPACSVTSIGARVTMHHAQGRHDLLYVCFLCKLTLSTTAPRSVSTATVQGCAAQAAAMRRCCLLLSADRRSVPGKLGWHVNALLHDTSVLRAGTVLDRLARVSGNQKQGGSPVHAQGGKLINSCPMLLSKHSE